MKTLDRITDRARSLAQLSLLPRRFHSVLNGYKIFQRVDGNKPEYYFSFFYAQQMYNKGYMPYRFMCCSAGINLLHFLEKVYEEEDPKNYRSKVSKIITLCNELFQSTVIEFPNDYYLENNKMRYLIKVLPFDKFYIIFKNIYAKMIRKNNIEDTNCEAILDLHDFLINLPKIRENDNPQELFDIILRVISYNKTLATEILPYINYQKIRKAANSNEMLRFISKVVAARNGYTTSLEQAAERMFYGSLTELQNFETSEEQTEEQKKLIDIERNTCSFSKNIAIISSIGRETGCCFRKGGEAGRLLEPAIKSPLAGILHGYIPFRWFSFVWEMVTYDSDENMFWKNIVLDNVESKGRISMTHWQKIMDIIKSANYKNYLCGTLRNDVSFDTVDMEETVIKRPYALIGYENKFNPIYDDSKYLYTLHTNANHSNDVKLRRMNYSDLLRCGYIERIIYGEKSDNEFIKKKNIAETPSFILDSDFAIYGYIVTSVRQASDPNLQEIINVIPAAINLEDKFLYIDDVFCLNYQACKKTFRIIMEKIAQFCKDNNIVKVIASTNKYSDSLLMKLVKDYGLEVLHGINFNIESEMIEVIQKPNPQYKPTSVEILI